MDKKITCPQCGLGFNASEVSGGQSIQCPGCFAAIDANNAISPIEINGYQVLEMIGQGGMGQVFRALSPQGIPVAMKVMSQDLMDSDELQERFRREMKIMSSLNHPHIVSVFDQGETGDLRYFVMEFVEGETLRNIMRKGPVPEKTILKVAVEVLEALGYAHSKGIIHRDIKPENIMFDKKLRVKVTDFGLARKDNWGSSNHNSLTQAGAYLGTESYMSPEQKVSPKNVTHKSDIYSFGIVLYELLTDGSLPMGVFQPPTFFKPVHEFWDRLIFQLLDINPEMRPENCQAIIDELQEFEKLLDAPPGSPAPSFEPVKPRPVAPLPPKKQDSQDTLEKERLRLDDDFQRIIGKAKELSDAGQFPEALTLWEQALHMAGEAEDRQTIHQWIEICRDKIHEAEHGPKLTFLCPLCRKAFQKHADEHIPQELHCPLCTGPLRYDSVRKRIMVRDTALKPAQTKAAPPPVAEAPKEHGFLAAFHDPYLILLLATLATDWVSPDIMNGFFGYVVSLFRPPSEIGMVPNEANYFRMILLVTFAFLVFRSIVRMIGWYRSSAK